MNYFVWSYLKDDIYQGRPTNWGVLKLRICELCRTITPAVKTAACTRDKLRRFEVCLESNGAKLEHLVSKKYLLTVKHSSNNCTFVRLYTKGILSTIQGVN